MKGMFGMSKDWSKMHNTMFKLPKPKKPKGFKPVGLKMPKSKGGLKIKAVI